MAHLEPLFNNTAFRYSLMRTLFDTMSSVGPHAIGDAEAVTIAATLGIKGPNYFSCDPAQFGHGGDNIMSVVYAPSAKHAAGGHARAAAAGGAVEEEARASALSDGGAHAWVAWEDATSPTTGWSPAACNPYVRIDFDAFW